MTLTAGRFLSVRLACEATSHRPIWCVSFNTVFVRSIRAGWECLALPMDLQPDFRMNYPAASGRGIAPLKEFKLLDM